MSSICLGELSPKRSLERAGAGFTGKGPERIPQKKRGLFLWIGGGRKRKKGGIQRQSKTSFQRPDPEAFPKKKTSRIAYDWGSD